MAGPSPATTSRMSGCRWRRMDQRLEQEADILSRAPHARRTAPPAALGNAEMRARKAMPSPAANCAIGMPVGSTCSGELHAVGFRRWRIAVDGTTTASSALHWRREKPRAWPRNQPAGMNGCVVLQIFLEQRVVGGHHRQAEACVPRSGRRSGRRTGSGCGSGRNREPHSSTARCMARQPTRRSSGSPGTGRPATRTMPSSSASSP
jgi:hypothetical protein